MSEETATYTAGMHNGRGVEKEIPRPPVRTTRSLLPLSWVGRSVEITLIDGDSLTGTLLDLCGAGPIVQCRLSRSEACKRVVSWDALRFLDLLEGD